MPGSRAVGRFRNATAPGRAYAAFRLQPASIHRLYARWLARHPGALRCGRHHRRDQAARAPGCDLAPDRRPGPQVPISSSTLRVGPRCRGRSSCGAGDVFVSDHEPAPRCRSRRFPARRRGTAVVMRAFRSRWAVTVDRLSVVVSLMTGTVLTGVLVTAAFAMGWYGWLPVSPSAALGLDLS